MVPRALRALGAVPLARRYGVNVAVLLTLLLMAMQDNIQFRVIDPDFHYMMMELFKYGAPSNGLYGALPSLPRPSFASVE